MSEREFRFPTEIREALKRKGVPAAALAEIERRISAPDEPYTGWWEPTADDDLLFDAIHCQAHTLAETLRRGIGPAMKDLDSERRRADARHRIAAVLGQDAADAMLRLERKLRAAVVILDARPRSKPRKTRTVDPIAQRMAAVVVGVLNACGVKAGRASVIPHTMLRAALTWAGISKDPEQFIRRALGKGPGQKSRQKPRRRKGGRLRRAPHS